MKTDPVLIKRASYVHPIPADISIPPIFFDKEGVDPALNDMKDATELKTLSSEDVYKGVYSDKIKAYKSP